MTSLNKQEREDLKRQTIQAINRHLPIHVRLLIVLVAVCALFRPGVIFLTIAIQVRRHKDRLASLSAKIEDLADAED
jgi:uncharacterized membrane protein YhaH (DUF805 family)